MRVVSNNTDDDVRANRADERVQKELLELFSNVLRIVAGAGNPERLQMQIVGTLAAMTDPDARAPTKDVVARIVDAARPSPHDPLDPPRSQIAAASLRWMAARIDGNLTQETKAESALHEASRDLERLRRENGRFEVVVQEFAEWVIERRRQESGDVWDQVRV